MTKHTVCLAKSRRWNIPSPSSSDLFRLANQMRGKHLDVYSTCPQWRWRAVSRQQDSPSSLERALRVPPKCRVRLDPDCLTEVYPVEGPALTSHWSWWASPSSWWSVPRLLVHPWNEAKCTISFSGTVNLKYTPYDIHTVLLCFVLLWLYWDSLLDSCELFTHQIQGYFIGIHHVVTSPQLYYTNRYG